MNTRSVRHRLLPLLLASLVALTGILGSAAADDATMGAGCAVQAVPPQATTPAAVGPVHEKALRAYSETMTETFDPAFLEEQDELLQEQYLVDLRSLVDPEDPMAGLLPPQELSSDGDTSVGSLKHAYQDIEHVPTSGVNVDSVDLSDVQAPAIHVGVDVIEDSRHKEHWSFDAYVTVLCGTAVVGTSEPQHKAFKDNGGSHDFHHLRMSFPLSEIAENLNGQYTVQIHLRTQYCKVGWMSGWGKHPGGERCLLEKEANDEGYIGHGISVLV